MMRLLGALALLTLTVIVGCSYEKYQAIHPPQYDHIVGKRFGEVVFQGRKVFRRVKDLGTVEELQKAHPGNCVLIFGVRKEDDVILYWRVDSGPGTCLESRVPYNP